MFNLIFLTLSLFQLLFHLKINLSFISFHFFISKLLRKRFYFISCFKNLRFLSFMSAAYSAVNHRKFCTLNFVYTTWPIEANHTYCAIFCSPSPWNYNTNYRSYYSSMPSLKVYIF